ncbi:MAG TPA: family 43 glycosylhydrolase [Prolixibacteraceae bacterium]|nr:family 43 glycosylhydrolase [Prolixibacteraceae bacterium]HOS90408.1 family 43 glycosylhydrolase [Prolixibacteraceae bacterium]HPL45178.1 family 43 glycosylhydrolase [Prolixibacteraceae bacterium]
MKKKFWPVWVVILLITACHSEKQPSPTGVKTICNPVNISYRFCLDEPSRREAADPTIVWFKERYYLFASKSGGYWHSSDLGSWTFVETAQIPTEEYAPTAIALGDTLYFLASSTEKSTIYKSGDPLSGAWQVAVEELEIPVWDPAFFLDDDQRLFLYWGCSNQNPLYGVEVDAGNGFAFKGEPVELIHADPANHGWEVPGDYSTLTDLNPWIEGAWMNKLNGKYYLQYAGPGTEFKSYNDGVYVSDQPLGPFIPQEHNPFAYRPEGFAAGAGHGSTFEDRYGNLWHIGTITISQKHMFERRLGLFPVFLDEKGILHTETGYGDYPVMIPDKKVNSFEEIFPGWMLLSYGKKVEVSSSVDSLPASRMTDEEIRTYWAAATGNAGEYALLDLGAICCVHAVQLNFAEHNTALKGRQKNLRHRYILEYSADGTDWTMLADRSQSDIDLSHDLISLDNKIECRYLKVTNLEVPDGHFALSGFRVFGLGKGEMPGKVAKLEANRDPQNRRQVSLTWEGPENADGYVVSYGIDSTKLYLDYMLFGTTSLTISSLDAQQDYFFTIEAFNENGITKSGLLIYAGLGDN